MRFLRISSALLALAAPLPAVALSCDGLPETPDILTKGPQCSATYSGGKVYGFSDPRESLKIGPAEWFSATITRQKMQSSGGCTWEEISVFHDCASGRSVLISAVAYGEIVAEDEERHNASDAAHRYKSEIEPKIKPGFTLDQIYDTVKNVKWIEQKQQLERTKVQIDARRIDLSCGCKLPRP